MIGIIMKAVSSYRAIQVAKRRPWDPKTGGPFRQVVTLTDLNYSQNHATRTTPFA